MKERAFALAAMTAVLVAGAAPAAAQMAEDTDRRLEMLFGESLPYAEFFDTLKIAVESSNGDAVAELVFYPSPSSWTACR